jgi:hypothetical protein
LYMFPLTVASLVWSSSLPPTLNENFDVLRKVHLVVPLESPEPAGWFFRDGDGAPCGSCTCRDEMSIDGRWLLQSNPVLVSPACIQSRTCRIFVLSTSSGLVDVVALLPLERRPRLRACAGRAAVPNGCDQAAFWFWNNCWNQRSPNRRIMETSANIYIRLSYDPYRSHRRRIVTVK